MIGQEPENSEGGSQDEAPTETSSDKPASPSDLPPEFGGRDGPEPTRYGDWEKNGRCIDF